MQKNLTLLIILTISSIFLTISTLFSQTVQLPTGYGNATWGTSIDGVKSAILGRLVFSDDETIIISRDGNLEYTYGFFYTDPQKVERPANAQEAPNSILYYVAIRFPYIPIDQVRAKFEAQYGAITIDNVSKNRGVIGWLTDETLALVYIDEYEDKQYAARITYVSRNIIKQVNEYVSNVFNQTEIDVMKGLTP